MAHHPQLKSPIVRALLITGLILPAILPVSAFISAQGEMAHFSEAHFIYPSEFGVTNPQGMAFLPDENSFIVWSAGQGANVITLHEEGRGKITLPQQPADPLSAAFDSKSKSLFFLGAGNTQLSKLSAKQAGLPNQANTSVTGFDIRSFDLQDAQGLTFDPATGRLFILDARQPQVLVVSPHPAQGFDGASAAAAKRIGYVNIRFISRAALRGIAFNPNNGHLYVGSPTEKRIYEITEAGDWVTTYDVSDLPLTNASTMLFAPSRDNTDDPMIMDLYVLDSGQSFTQTNTLSSQKSVFQSGQIAELSLQSMSGLPAGTTLLPSALVHMIDTSNVAWSPSSPDPSGIDYWPLTGNLLVSDSEVEEMAVYAGKNVYESTTSGALVGTCTTVGFSNEPSGLATNPDNNHIFFSDDDGSNDKIIEVNIGADATYCTADDARTSTNAATLYGANDTEDLAYGANTIFIADGINAEVYRIPLGPNGVLGGGDDGSATHFDTAILGFSDLEGIDYNSDSGTLLIVSTHGTENYLGEVTTTGTLVNAYNLSFMGTTGNLRSDVSYAPSTLNPALNNIYIVSRGIDNAPNPNENDGKIWEINISGPSTAPTVTSVVRANASPTNAASVNYTVTFSENVSGVNVPDFTLTTTGVSGASVSGVIGSGTTYTVTVDTGSGNGTIRLDVLNDNSIIDAVGSSLNGGFSSGQVYSIEKVGVTVSSVTRANANPTNASNVGYTVIFSEAVTGVDLTDFALTTTGVSGASISGITGSGATYTVTVNTGSGDGTILLDVLDDDTILNINNQPLISGFTSGEVYNVIKSATFANIQVLVGVTSQGTYSVAPKYSLKQSYAGLDNGPVKVISTNNIPIVASERVAYSPDGGTTWTSYSELMGLPVSQLASSYTFPWYNNIDLNSQLRFGNVGTANTTVTVTIGGVFKGNYNLAPNASTRISYAGLDSGPVKVSSSGNVPIIASMRVAYFDGSNWTSFSEMMGMPTSKLTNSYVFPWYNNIDLNSQLRFGNVGTVPTTVTVTVGGVFKGSYQLAVNESKRISYAGLDAGPVRITSSGNVPIIASMRVAYNNGTAWTDFSEMMGLPTSSLSTHYSFPAYDNVHHNSQLRFGNVGTSSTTVTVTINGVVQGTYSLAPNQSNRVSYVGLDSGPVVIHSSGNVPIIASERVAYFDGDSWTSFAEMMGLPQSQLTTTFLFPWYNNLDLDTQLRFGVP